MWTTALVSPKSLLQSATSPHRNTRSHGTSTWSKITTQSISSKREASGASKCDGPASNESRHMNLSPLALQLIAKASANGSSAGSSRNTVEGNTSNSSDNGPKVASM